MAIDYNSGISSLQTGAPDIKYTGNQGPRSPQEQQMASADPMLVEEYNKYVFEMEEQGRQPVSFKEFVQQIMSGMAYGGTAKPTYTQSRKQNLAYGGIAGLDGRKKYGIGSWFQEKVMDPIKKVIPNEIKDNPMLTAAIVGGGINQFGLPDWMVPDQIATGSNVGQNWLGNLINQDLVLGKGGEQTGDLGFNLLDPKTYFPGKSVEATAAMEDIGIGGKEGVFTPTGLINPFNLAPGKNIPGQTSTELDAIKYAQGLPTGTSTGTKLKNLAGQFLGGDGDGGQQYDEQGRPKVRWMEPLAIGTAMGAAQAAMPKAQLPTDTSGINIADIRRRALTGSDPDLHFLPPPEATREYAQGGRIGYADAGNVRMASHAGNDAWLEQRMEELMELGMSFEAAAAQAQKELREGNVGPQDLAQGGRIRAQEGGLMNLGGMEKDYRQEGGFVPLGGEERADDVPARLSKNEFVFTADAVRAAGGGDIDAGAEVMENLMNNLERGGQVSEESQGLEGARDMFATAQRLEGVM